MRISVLASVLVVSVGCSPLVEPLSDAGVTDAGGAPADAGSSGPDAGTRDAGSAADSGIALPVVTSATVITHGSIRVQWTNPSPACDALSLQRSKDGAAAVTASQPSSTATETLDSPGHASGTYCYSLTCTRGSVMQGSSNQKCASQ